ncbi:hypothetical protein [Elizabethkingia miricola]|uniref:hypothetical protein n=1 Tax=Elizabethkingia miricola TaxID=172045 RepID=UPI003891C35A
MNTEDTFNQEIKNIPFINCVDKNIFYTEYLNIEKHQIINTATYKKLIQINTFYETFFFILKHKGNTIDRYKEPEIHANSIIREIKYFSNDIQVKIIDAIINNDHSNNIVSEYISMQYNNPKYDKDYDTLLNQFKNQLSKYKHELVSNKPDVETCEYPTSEILTISQKQKIGLLIRSGIIDFLREKNPKITNNQIAGFIELLSKESMKRTSINPHLSKDNKHPIQNKQDKDELDYLLSKYGITPQSE